MKIEEKQLSENEETFLLVVDYQMPMIQKSKLVFPVSEKQLVQLAHEILRQFAPTTEDLILEELRRLNDPKNENDQS